MHPPHLHAKIAMHTRQETTDATVLTATGMTVVKTVGPFKIQLETTTVNKEMELPLARMNVNDLAAAVGTRVVVDAGAT